jgi:hypothetical protein
MPTDQSSGGDFGSDMSPGSADVQSMMRQFGQAGQAGQAGGNSQGNAGGLGGGAANPLAGLTGLPGAKTAAGNQSQAKARPIGTPLQEAKYFAQDVTQGVLSVLPDFMQEILGIKPMDTPQDQARKRQMLQNYQKMNAEQQQIVQQKLRADMAKKKQEEEAQQRAAAQQKAAQSELPTPSSKHTGAAAPIGGQSKKKSFMDDFNQKRQQLSSAG